MITKIKQFIVVGLAGFAMLVPSLAVPAVGGGLASAAIKDSLCTGADAASQAGGSSTGKSTCTTTGESNAESGLKKLASTIVKYFSIIVGAISIIMIIYGGFRYITSGGDSGKVGSAKNTLIYAIVGLIIVALAQLIVRVVVTQAGEATTDL